MDRALNILVERKNGLLRGPQGREQNDQLHRVEGPAIESANGDKYWFQNGKLHRVDGPAIEYITGHKCWYLEGVKLSETEFITKTTKNLPTEPLTTSITKVPISIGSSAIEIYTVKSLSSDEVDVLKQSIERLENQNLNLLVVIKALTAIIEASTSK